MAIADQNLEPIAATTVAPTTPYYTSAQQTTYTGATTTITEVMKVDAPEKVDYYQADIALSSITSRFEIGTIIAGENITSLVVTNVFFNNYFGSYSMNTDGIVNIATDLWTGASPAGIAPWAMIAGSTDVTSTAGTKAYAYQAYAGLLIPQIIFQVSGVSTGTLAGQEAPGAFENYYVTIKGFTKSTNGVQTQLTTLNPHTVYQVAMDAPLTVNATAITPEPDKDEVGLVVNVTVKEWSKETLTPEI